MHSLTSIYDNLTTLYIEIASDCNMRCRYCYNNSGFRENKMLSIDTIKNILISAGKDSRISTIILSGGEPFLYPEIDDLIAMICNLGYKLRIYTNGTLLTSDIVKRLVYYRPSLQITLDSASKEWNDLYKGEGSFLKICSALDLLHREYYMENVTVRCNLNYEFIDCDNVISDYIRLLEKFDVKVAYFALINNQGRAKNDYYPAKNRDMDSLLKFRKRVLTYSGIGNLRLEAPVASICQFCPYVHIDMYHGDYLLHITPDGNVYPCSALAYTKYVLGNIYQSNIKDICYGDALSLFVERAMNRAQMNRTCNDCPFRRFCGKGCLGELPATENMEGTDGQCVYRKKEISKLLINRCMG